MDKVPIAHNVMRMHHVFFLTFNGDHLISQVIKKPLFKINKIKEEQLVS